MTSCKRVGFPENVIPERGLAPPARGSDAHLLHRERGDSDETGHRLTRREAPTLPALQVTDGERMIVFDLALTGDGYWQLHECSHQLPVDFL